MSSNFWGFLILLPHLGLSESDTNIELGSRTFMGIEIHVRTLIVMTSFKCFDLQNIKKKHFFDFPILIALNKVDEPTFWLFEFFLFCS